MCILCLVHKGNRNPWIDMHCMCSFLYKVFQLFCYGNLMTGIPSKNDQMMASLWYHGVIGRLFTCILISTWKGWQPQSLPIKSFPLTDIKHPNCFGIVMKSHSRGDGMVNKDNMEMNVFTSVIILCFPSFKIGWVPGCWKGVGVWHGNMQRQWLEPWMFTLLHYIPNSFSTTQQKWWSV